MSSKLEVGGFSELGCIFVFLSNLRRDGASFYLKSELGRADRAANKILFSSVGLFIVLAITALFIDKKEPIPEWVELLILMGVVGVQVLGLISILVRLGGAISLGLRRKKVALTHFILEVESDEQHVSQLALYRYDLLEKARRYLELKIKRTERRIGSILGDKTAVLSLLALSVTLINNLGGLDSLAWLFASIPEFFSARMLLIGFLSFLLGLSIGAILLNSSIEAVRYQLELIELAQAEQQRRAADLPLVDANQR